MYTFVSIWAVDERALNDLSILIKKEKRRKESEKSGANSSSSISADKQEPQSTKGFTVAYVQVKYLPYILRNAYILKSNLQSHKVAA